MASCPTLQRLAWDTGHFGWETAAITATRLSDGELRSHLTLARSLGIRLVYWRSCPAQPPSAAVLDAWAGELTDRKTTFQADPTHWRSHSAVRRVADVTVTEWPRGEPSGELLELAVIAGTHSRFHKDRRISEDQFRGLYETWMRRSTSGDLADRVFVAMHESDGAIGMVTAKLRETIGEIGLVAVQESCQGHGIGEALMRRALDWFDEVRASAAVVVTQQDNAPACRMYDRLGFTVTDVSNVYHFWPQEGAGI